VVKKQLGELTVAIEKSGRGFKGSLYYEGGPIPITDDERILKEVKGKTEDAVLAAAQAWIDKRTPKKILIACTRCMNGVELNKKVKKGKMEIYCGACGAVVYRGAPIKWQ
jgi:hypothetical protein